MKERKKRKEKERYRDRNNETGSKMVNEMKRNKQMKSNPVEIR